MSRKTSTVLTLRIRVNVPSNSNASEVMEKIRQCLSYEESKYFENGDVAVNLLKKETNYA